MFMFLNLLVHSVTKNVDRKNIVWDILFLRPTTYAMNEKKCNLTKYRQDNYFGMSPEMKDNALGGGRDGTPDY